MANEILNSLLREYDKKKLKAELDLDRRKENLYKLIPRLEEIDEELNAFAFKTAKSILNKSTLSDNTNNTYTVEALQQKIDELKKEKEAILIKNNLNLEYLKPFYECKLCNDTGFVTTNNYNTVMCSCLKQKLLDISFNKSNIYNIKKENFDNFNELIFSNEVDFAKYKFNISPIKNIINIKNKCIDFINNFENPNSKNLLFVGSTGLRQNLHV